MEKQSSVNGVEVRRLHIVYFLSRKGRLSIDHPHLIRVHHLSRNGVRLRDIKRWLGELRGKDMPDSFAWSYKRIYKTGYVWQDLLDDDLITPISDNEYVLKGSEISNSIKDLSILKKKVQMKKEENLRNSENDVSTKMSSTEVEEESPIFGSESSTITDESITSEKEVKKPKDNVNNIIIQEKEEEIKAKKNSKKMKNYDNSKASSSIFRSLISCGAVDTNEAAVVMINKEKNPLLSSSEVLCKNEKIGGSQRIFGTFSSSSTQQQQWNGRRSCDGRVPSGGVYKPINMPNCS